MDQEKRRQGSGEEGAGLPVIVHALDGVWTLEDHLALRDYLDAHVLMEGQPGGLADSEVRALAAELDAPLTPVLRKKRVLIVLAHQGGEVAERELSGRLGRLGRLDRFARFACEEARQWTSHGARAEPGGACACGDDRMCEECRGRGTS